MPHPRMWSEQSTNGTGTPFRDLRRRIVFAALLSTGVMFWHHAVNAVFLGESDTVAGHTQTIALGALLGIPFALAAIAFAGRIAGRAAVSWRSPSWKEQASFAATVSLVFGVLMVPLMALQTQVQQLVTGAGGHGHAATAGSGLAGLVEQGVRYAVISQPVAFLIAMLMVGFMLAPTRAAAPAQRRQLKIVFVAATTALVTTSPLSPATADISAPPENPQSIPSGGSCDDPVGTTRTFNVQAINVDIPLNRWGDHDPFGFMYALKSRVGEIRDFEAAVNSASPTARVSRGLMDDPIQPLVLRANLGDCVVINFENRVTKAPRGGPGEPPTVEPGGPPALSMDVQGVAYEAGEGGNAIGNNPNTMVRPGQNRQYKFYLDTLMGEGAKTFHSGGESRQVTAHGLFGALIAEPQGSRWYDPRTGAEKTNDTTWNSWDAMIQPPDFPSFREFAIMYHEVGDENFNIRRPVSEDANGDGIVPPHGESSPMVDVTITQSYRPGGRAINYRSESFWRRLTEMGQVAFPGAPNLVDLQHDKKALGYSSYTFGDPATPIPTSYLGEPTKTRLMHPGAEQLHVHHLHGGGDRWRANPNADDPNAMLGGLRKEFDEDQRSIRLDSQTVGPDETYNLEHECGAGGCQQAAGDFLFHCHIAHHYIAGMWSFWRVHDTAQADLAPLPQQAKPAAAVTSDQLIGRTFEGKTIVADSQTPGANQIRLRDWVEPLLPPRGVRNNTDDATVWDWARVGNVYQGEPETPLTWSNYDPGVGRPNILFNPGNGRYAWPLFRPHLGERPPFSPNGHSGAPWLGENASSARPDGLCPTAPQTKSTFNVVAIQTPINNTENETDPEGRIFELAEEKNAVTPDNAEPLVLRSNVGDCVALTLTSELVPEVQHKVNMHTHFVQFDPQASDGVITGFSYEQSVNNYQHEGTNGTGRVIQSASGSTVTVSDVGGLRVGIFLGVGLGTNDIEIRRITAINGNTITLDRALTKAHPAGQFAGVEFVQYRWFSDVDYGTVFFHDHVDGITSWAHGLFAAHIIEPPGSTYHNPTNNAAIRSGTQAIIRTDGKVGVDHRRGEDFREFMIFLHNGRRGRPEILANPRPGILLVNFGQECEEGSINLRAAPIDERADEDTQLTRWNGGVCRNGILENGQRVDTPFDVTTTDPYVFSSVKNGDPRTPLLRAYAGDPVVIRTIGLVERVDALRISGHRFKRERFNAFGESMDAMTTGISERFDYVLEGGAGGPRHVPGDYLYYSTRNFAFNSGAWGIFRVHDTLQPNLVPLDHNQPVSGAGFPRRTFTGQNPTPPQAGDSTINPCVDGAPLRRYDVTIFDVPLPGGRSIDPDPDDDPATNDAGDGRDKAGLIYALTNNVASIKADPSTAEPLVLRANQLDCVEVTLRNGINQNSEFWAGTRASFELAKATHNVQRAGGSAVGFNPDTTVAPGGSFTYRFSADLLPGTSIFQNLANPASLIHGAYGLLITEPFTAQWFDSETGQRFDNSLTNGFQNRTSSKAIIRALFGIINFREFAITMGTSDAHYGRSIIPYWETIAGTGQASTNPANPPAQNFPAGDPRRDQVQPGFNSVSYKTANTLARLQVDGQNHGDAYLTKGLAGHGTPETPLLRAYAGDPTVIRVGVPASNQFHVFNIGGHIFPWEPHMWHDKGDFRSQLLTGRALTSGETLDAELVGGAGTRLRATGDYMYRDSRLPFTQAGMWGILRVLPSGASGGPAAL